LFARRVKMEKHARGIGALDPEDFQRDAASWAAGEPDRVAAAAKARQARLEEEALRAARARERDAAALGQGADVEAPRPGATGGSWGASPSYRSLFLCPACRNEVSKRAVSCPKCGHPINKSSPWAVFLMIVLWGVILVVLGPVFLRLL
jgi:hypothetical protein